MKRSEATVSYCLVKVLKAEEVQGSRCGHWWLGGQEPVLGDSVGAEVGCDVDGRRGTKEVRGSEIEGGQNMPEQEI